MDRGGNILGSGASLLEAQGPCTTPLDLAIEYSRSRIDRLLPTYVLAMAPHAVVAVWLIDAITGERRRHIATYSLYLVLCMFWRWIWLARLQYDVVRDLRGIAAVGFWRRLPQVLIVRLFSHFAITWGALLAGIPFFYGFYTSSFAAPLLFESMEPAAARVRRLLSWVQHSGKRLLRVLIALSVVASIVTTAVFVSQMVLSRTVLPSLLGIDAVDLDLTLNSWAWRLRMLYFIFLALDFYWSVAAVFVYFDSQSRRMATDLRARLEIVADVQP